MSILDLTPEQQKQLDDAITAVRPHRWPVNRPQARCKTCRYWEPPHRDGGSGGSAGECRYEPPKVLIPPPAMPGTWSTGPSYIVMWPPTGPEAWCGKWEAQP